MAALPSTCPPEGASRLSQSNAMEAFGTEYGSARSINCNAEETEIKDEVATSTSSLLRWHRARCSPTPSNSTPISPVEARNLLFLALSYTCVASSTTLIVGGSAVVVISVGGGSDVAPIALSSFFAGSSLVSLTTMRLFDGLGRKRGFIVGSIMGIIGGAMGASAVALSSPALVVASAFPVGCANGIGQHLRFAAMEVVDDAKSLAMTLTLSGGCLAAFLGPESQALTRFTFGDELEYLGLFIMIIIFNAVSSVLVSLVQFTAVKDAATRSVTQGSQGISRDGDAKDATSRTNERRFESDESIIREQQQSISTTALLLRFDFFSSAALASLSWSIMAMPMSIVRVAMNEVGYTARLSLTTLELHFLAMFAPGFVTGGLIKRLGVSMMRYVGLAIFIGALLSNLFSKPAVEGGTVASWMAGLALLGIGWNIIFSSATVMLATIYTEAPATATKIQATNDFIMFGVSGALVVSTGYIFQAGGSGLSGWILLNTVVLGFVSIMLALLIVLTWRSRTVRNGMLENGVELTNTFDVVEAA